MQQMNANSKIDFVSTEQIRYISGRTVLEEAFWNGRLVTRYLNANAQIMAERHFHPSLHLPSDPAEVFRLTVNERELSGCWQWGEANFAQDNSVIHLKHEEVPLSVKLHTRSCGNSFLIRSLELINEGMEPLRINSVYPLAGALWNHRTDEEVLPAECASAFSICYTHRNQFMEEGDFYWDDLAGGITEISGGLNGKSGWGHPGFWLYDKCNGQTFVCDLAWSGNWHVLCETRRTELEKLFFRIGLASTEPVIYSLAPEEHLNTPEVHFGMFHADTDGIVNAVHEHVRRFVLPPLPSGRNCEAEANHRGYICNSETVEGIQRDADLAKAFGTELYVIDAGWYGKEPNRWFHNVGDWHDGPWMYGGGVKAVADYVHSIGMKFGLWVEIEACGKSSQLHQDHPDWLLCRDGIPIAGGRALDITKEEVYHFEKETIRRLIRECHLDMFRIDNNHALLPIPAAVRNGIREDSTWRYMNAFYRMFAELKAEFPDVVFQNCSSGGGRNDYGIMRYFHNQEVSDWGRLPRGFKILNGMTMFYPPETLLRIIGTEAREHQLDGGFPAQALHPFSKLIIRGIAPDFKSLPTEMERQLNAFMECWKNRIRPVMEDGMTYHHTPFLPVMKSTPWCVLEYASKNKSAAVAVVMHTSCLEKEYLFRPRGIDPGKTYRAEFFFGGQQWKTSGKELIFTGIPVRLEQSLAAELILLNEVDG